MTSRRSFLAAIASALAAIFKPARASVPQLPPRLRVSVDAGCGDMSFAYRVIRTYDPIGQRHISRLEVFYGFGDIKHVACHVEGELQKVLKTYDPRLGRQAQV